MRPVRKKLLSSFSLGVTEVASVTLAHLMRLISMRKKMNRINRLRNNTSSPAKILREATVAWILPMSTTKVFGSQEWLKQLATVGKRATPRYSCFNWSPRTPAWKLAWMFGLIAAWM